MGYCMSQRDGKFFIKAERKLAALIAAKSLAPVGAVQGGSTSYSGGRVIHRAFRWMANYDLQTASSLEEMLKWWRWQPKTDSDGNIVKVQFDGEKAGDDMYLWTALAPFIEADSFIEMQGEDGALWRWVFDGSSVKEVAAKVVW
jgi:hypothetical protein